MTADERNAGLEKMARAICCPHRPCYLVLGGREPCKIGGVPLEKAAAALAAWEAHMEETWPTPEMCAAGASAIMDSGIGDFHAGDTEGYHTISARLNSEEAATVFRAMIAAAKQKAPAD